MQAWAKPFPALSSQAARPGCQVARLLAASHVSGQKPLCTSHLQPETGWGPWPSTRAGDHCQTTMTTRLRACPKDRRRHRDRLVKLPGRTAARPALGCLHPSGHHPHMHEQPAAWQRAAGYQPGRSYFRIDQPFISTRARLPQHAARLRAET